MPNQKQNNRESVTTVAENVFKSLLTSWVASSTNWNVSVSNRPVPHARVGIKVHYVPTVDFFLWMIWSIKVSSASKYVHSIGKGCCSVKISIWRWFSLHTTNDLTVSCKKKICDECHLGIHTCFDSVSIHITESQSLLTLITNSSMW
jgi:hypothetical protein